MALRKQNDHAGSGIDQPVKRGWFSKLLDTVRRPAAAQNPPATKP